MRGLEGKVAIISGSAQGIGRGCAQRMAAEGAKVVVADQRDDTTTVDEIRAAGGTAHQVVMDVRRREDWQRTVAEAKEQFGRVDLLGNVAGVVNMQSPDNVLDLTDEAWDTVLNTNLRGTWLGMQAVIPELQAGGGGRVVNISSGAALHAAEELAAYSASKAGVLGLTRQAALTYAPEAINVNAIAPGTIETPILGNFDDEGRQLFAQSHMIKRLGQPADIAGMMAMLFSDDASFVTGMTFSVDGGWNVNGRCH